MADAERIAEPSGWRTVAFAVAFVAVTSLTIFSTRFGGGLALVWFGTAILAALLLNLPYRAWPRTIIYFGCLSMCATALFGFGPFLAAPLALVNVFEAGLIAGLLARLRPGRDYLESWSGFSRLVLVAGVVGPLVTSVPAGFLVASVIGGAWTGHAAQWFAAHGLGTVLALPLAILFARGSVAGMMKVATRRARWELAAVTLGNAAVATVAFYQAAYPLLFLPILPAIFACFRLGRIGAAVSVLVIAVIASSSLALGVGVFAALDVPLAEQTTFLQFYLAVMLLVILPIAAALKHREIVHGTITRREALYRMISDHSDDAMLSLGATGTIRFASPASCRLSGVDDLADMPLAAFFAPEDEGLIDGLLARAAAEPGVTKVLERPVVRNDASVWFEAKVRAVGDNGAAIAGFVVTVRDVTARKEEELQAAHDASTDPLTGLPNRRAFLKELEPALAAAAEQPFSLAIIDLDHFKSINDRYGHDVGDLVLKHVALIMRRLSKDGCFFARLGGEEFGLVVRSAEPGRIGEICERLRAQIHEHQIRDADGRDFGVSASIGVAHLREPCTVSLALQTADAPLYAAKAGGRNRVHVASGPLGWKHRSADASEGTRHLRVG
ncbi:diguanylate cyclase domain-containing protein [Pelagerythrobacter sp.]|uniref:sensor domain-containing diguanylate cyclase n=1 Tax=Pelagerythrobacter sp. TaxID=2800702 RepID=UPI0035B2DAD6